MNKNKDYIRRTISISPDVNKILLEGAREEFAGNLSAFLAHIALDYKKCKNCSKIGLEEKNVEPKNAENKK